MATSISKLTVHFSPTLFFTELLLYFYLIWLAESFHINFMKFTDMIETMSLQCVCVNEWVCECNILVRVFSHLAVHLSTKNKLGWSIYFSLLLDRKYSIINSLACYSQNLLKISGLYIAQIGIDFFLFLSLSFWLSNMSLFNILCTTMVDHP